jgi:hypothetical protein
MHNGKDFSLSLEMTNYHEVCPVEKTGLKKFAECGKSATDKAQANKHDR